MKRDDPVDELFREVERLLDEMMENMPRGRAVDAGMVTESITGGDAHVDIQETDSGLRVVADIPGVDEDTITLQCDT